MSPVNNKVDAQAGTSINFSFGVSEIKPHQSDAASRHIMIHIHLCAQLCSSEGLGDENVWTNGKDEQNE